MSDLSPTDIAALDFLGRVGTDCVGEIDTEEKLAAAIVFNELQKRGFVISVISPQGPVYQLSNKGRALLASAAPQGGAA